MRFTLENLYKSVVKHVQDTIQACHTAGYTDTLEYYAWDSRGPEDSLGDGDLLGLAGWSFRENGGLWEVRAGLTLSTYNDKNLFREIKMMNIIHDLWGEQHTIPMLDDSGNEFTQMVVSDFDMMPAGNSEQRNYRPIGIELLRTES